MARHRPRSSRPAIPSASGPRTTATIRSSARSSRPSGDSIARGYTVFDTVAGFVAIGWNAGGIDRLRLPAATARDAEWALLRQAPGAPTMPPPPWVQAVIDDARRYFVGERVDFAAVPVDLGPQEPFFDRVYAAVRALGWGETATYGGLARMLDVGPEYARDVGQAMAANPVPLIVPCHRVTAANGRIGGFSAPGGSLSKARMLKIEGVAVRGGIVVRDVAQLGLF